MKFQASQATFGVVSKTENCAAQLMFDVQLCAACTVLAFKPPRGAYLMANLYCCRWHSRLIHSPWKFTPPANLRLPSLSGMPSLNSHRKLVKSVLTAFGMKRCHALTFAGHRAVYVLGGLQAAKETLESLLSKLNEPPTKNAIAKVANDMSKGLAVLRQMVKQISSMDLEFVETRLCVRAGQGLLCLLFWVGRIRPGLGRFGVDGRVESS